MDINTALVFVGMCVPFIALTIWAVVSAARRDFGSMGRKTLWMGIAAIPFVGFIIYLVFGFRKGRRAE